MLLCNLLSSTVHSQALTLTVTHKIQKKKMKVKTVTASQFGRKFVLVVRGSSLLLSLFNLSIYFITQNTFG